MPLSLRRATTSFGQGAYPPGPPDGRCPLALPVWPVHPEWPPGPGGWRGYPREWQSISRGSILELGEGPGLVTYPSLMPRNRGTSLMGEEVKGWGKS